MSARQPLRVLVVDDFEPWRHIVTCMITMEPELLVVGEASDGLEAVQKAAELKPDLILLDIGLTTLSGIEAARQIRKVSPNSKILFVSTYASLEIAEEALKTGANGYVLKGDAGNELAKAVEAVFQGKQFISSRLKGCTSADTEDAQGPHGFGPSGGLA